jgi:RsiW-degrading membrane proteinase PrsW (M82 family)
VLGVLRWLLPAVLPALLFLFLIWRTDRNREPLGVVLGTFAFSALTGAGAFFVEHKAAAWTGLAVQADVAGDAGALLFLFAVVAPLRETAKVVAVWPAFRSAYFDEPYDGVVYASAAALGFAGVENVVLLRAHPEGAVWLARALLALPAHVFFASAWGWALGRAKQSHVPDSRFPYLWLLATLAHAAYIHFVEGRGPTALLVVLPMLLVMGLFAVLAARDLRRRGDERPTGADRLSRLSVDLLSKPPSLDDVRAVLRRERPVALRWVLFGAFVTSGAMILGVAAAVGMGAAVHVDFSVVDEQDVSTAAPVALLGSGLLAAFPLAGWLIARASGLPSLLEPALATALAIIFALVLLGLASPVSLVFAIALSPIAWGLACLGAWIGRPAS